MIKHVAREIKNVGDQAEIQPFRLESGGSVVLADPDEAERNDLRSVIGGSARRQDGKHPFGHSELRCRRGSVCPSPGLAINAATLCQLMSWAAGRHRARAFRCRTLRDAGSRQAGRQLTRGIYDCARIDYWLSVGGCHASKNRAELTNAKRGIIFGYPLQQDPN